MKKKVLNYRYQPFLLDAKQAHKTHAVVYAKNGAVTLKHMQLSELIGKTSVTIPANHQFPLAFASLSDLAKAISSLSNSPLFDGKQTLREAFDKEFQQYLSLVEKSQKKGMWEPDYGTYVYDHVRGDLFLIATEFWHRIGLVTSTGTLIQDPKQKKSWMEVRKILQEKVVGFIGASVGGNVIEGVTRELRPKQAKVADPDWIELNNLNRLEHGNLFFLGQSRAKRESIQNPFELPRINKAEMAAYQQQMIDPYSQWFVYPEGLTAENIDQFLLGNGKDEPKLDIVVEEADDFPLKVEIRKRCRELGIPVIMMTDFGHCVIVHFQDFAKDKKQPIGFGATDEKLQKSLDKAMTTGNRDDIFSLVDLLCGEGCIYGEFADWIHGRGEQPTSSLPQSGATALIAGGIGGKSIAMYFLGHTLPKRTIYDFKAKTVEVKK